MTGPEMLIALNADGEDFRSLYHEGWEGHFWWSVRFENGDAVLTVRFEDPEAPVMNTERKWKLTPVEVRGSDKRS